MNGIERIVRSTNSAEATARYWLLRAGNAGGPVEQDRLRSKVNQTEAGVRGPVVAADLTQRFITDRAVRAHGGGVPVAARLAVYRALLVDLRKGLDEPEAARWGVHYQTDYSPVSRLANVLAGLNTSGLPAKINTYTYTEYAYVTEQGEPLKVLHGDFETARERISQAHQVDISRVLPLVEL